MDSSLNIAHYHSRRADSHLRHLRFDEAIESHRKAASSLDETLQANQNNLKIVESIKLQRDFHLKNIELVRLKKVQYEKYKVAIEQQRLRNASFLDQELAKDRIESVCDLQISIFKALEESDVLLDSLNIRHSAQLDDDCVRISDGIKMSVENANANEVQLKRTKSQTSIIDDMHTLNHQLHILVYNLVSRIDESLHELDVLRDRLKSSEKERNHRQRKTSLQTSNKSSSDLSNKADVSPTSSERRGSVTGEERKIVLPKSSELPPLELPDFDYNF